MLREQVEIQERVTYLRRQLAEQHLAVSLVVSGLQSFGLSDAHFLTTKLLDYVRRLTRLATHRVRPVSAGPVVVREVRMPPLTSLTVDLRHFSECPAHGFPSVQESIPAAIS